MPMPLMATLMSDVLSREQQGSVTSRSPANGAQSCARADDVEILGIHHRASGDGRGVVRAPQLHQLAAKRRLLGFAERCEGAGRGTVVFAEELHDVRRSERVLEPIE